MITPKEFAEIHKVAYTTVINWLRQELINGVQKVELPHMRSHVYMVPKDARPPTLKPGPKKGTRRSQSGVIKDSADGGAQGELSVALDPTKKTAPSIRRGRARKAAKKGGAAK